MSYNSISRATKNSEVTQTNLKKVDSELRGLAIAMERLTNANLQEAPYTLTVPSDAPYTLRPGQKDQWRLDTPFEAHEEELQYATFLYRDSVDSLFALRSHHDLHHATLSPSRNGIPSGTSTPLQSTTVKKKISLSAYKNKNKTHVDNGSPATSLNGSGSQIDQHLPAQSSSGNSQEILKPLTPTHVETTSTKKKEARSLESGFDSLVTATTAPPKDELRPKPIDHLPSIEEPVQPSIIHPSADIHKSSSVSIQNQATAKSDETPALRLSSASAPETPKNHLKKPLQAPDAMFDTRKALPPLSVALSHHKYEENSIPELLSPSLKDVGLIDKLSDFNTLREPLIDAQKDLYSLPSEDIAIHGRLLTSATSILSASKSIFNSSSTNSGLAGAPSLVVKLKFAKTGRKRVNDLLKMRSKRKDVNSIQHGESVIQQSRTVLGKEQTKDNAAISSHQHHDYQKHSDGQRRQEAEITARKISMNMTSLRPEKREREEKATLEPLKRQKPIGELEQARTPQRFPSGQSHSPGPTSQPGSHKRNLSSSMKDLKASGMHATNGVMTPQGSSSTPLAPGSAEQKAPRSHVPGDLSSPHTWNDENKRLSDLGRDLKHKMDAIIKEKDYEDGVSQRTKLAALLGLESLLCYILAFSAKDKISSLSKNVPQPLEAWRSIIPLWKVVRNVSQKGDNAHQTENHLKQSNHLIAIAHVLSSVIRARIAAIEAETFAKVISSPQYTSQKTQDTFENLNELRASSVKASRILSTSVFAEIYPRSYAARPISVGGLLVETVPIVKMVSLFLEEWNEIHKTPWKQRLELGLCGNL